MIRISLAGRLAVEVDGVVVDDGGLGRLGRLALAYLVSERRRPVTRDELAEVLWGEELPRSWETSLRGLAFRLRGLLAAAGLEPTEALTSAFGCWQLDLPPDAVVDVEEGARELAAAEALLAGGRGADAQVPAAAAAAVAARGFLPEATGPWVERRQGELRELHLEALGAQADAAAACGDWAGAQRAAEDAVAVEPFRESAHLRLMQAHAGAGNRGEALRAYARCRQILADELGVSPSASTEAAYVALLGEEPVPGAGGVEAPPAAPATTLPLQLTRLVGRDEELAAVAKAVTDARLLTLTGTGGVGKTRLALAVAADLAPGFADGTFLVELAPLADPELLPQQVLGAVGLREEAGQAPLDTLAAHLRSRHVLLVLDNCEHLVAVSAALAERLLRACARLTILATSREPLGVPGEATWRVPSLSPAGARALFAERARSVRSDFEMTAANDAALTQLCQRLDNIPLAIELAAARINALSVVEIADRLDDRFRLLSGGARTAVPRQQTLRAMVDWTYDALSVDERRLFDHLAVFGSGFTLEAAGQVAIGPPGTAGIDQPPEIDQPSDIDQPPEIDIVGLLAGLVNKSLVLAEPPGPDGRTRYRLLETMRHYARERLAESGDAAAVRSRHLIRAVTLARDAEAALDGPDQAAVLDRLEAEHDDLRVALAWGTSGGDPEPALRLAISLTRFWEVRGHLIEGRGWLEAALTAGGGSGLPALRALALNGAAVLAQHQGDYAAAHGLYEHSLALRRRLDDRLGTAAALVGLANLSALQGELSDARARFEEALEIGRSLEEPHVVAAALTNLGWVSHAAGDLGAARALYEEALSVRRHLGDGYGTAMVMANLGDLALQQGDLDTAEDLQTEGLDLRRRIGDRSGVADSLTALGRVALARGDRATSRRLHGEALAVRRRVGDRPGMPASLSALAELARLDGDPATAARLLEESLAVATDLDDRHCVTLSLLHLARLARDQGDPAAADALYRRARPAPLGSADEDGVPPTTSTATWMEGLGAIAVADGHHERAARLLGAADALRQAIGTPLPAHEAADRNDAVAACSAGLGQRRFRAAFAEGAAMPIGDAARLALAR
ncbi:MAG: tetratricopeptide repeat protein [Actinomycetota bacterium]|nr:tetratricopeptide repeat protein [Actinomycetota bacterium]